MTISIEKFNELIASIPQIEVARPTNTLAHIFNHDTKENFISYWLAFLIDPECVGSMEPLNTLLQLAGYDNLQIFDGEEVEVVREKIFENGRRIDFYISTENLIVGIESKIWSDLENRQLRDYSESLKKIAEKEEKEVAKILIYPQKNQGANLINAVNDEGNRFDFRLITFEKLVEQFKSIRIDCINNSRAAFLMQDFITHMEEYILNIGEDFDCMNFEMLNFTKNNKKDLIQLNKIIKKTKEDFCSYISNELQERFPADDWEYNFQKSCTFFQVYKREWDKRAHFELQLNGRNDVFPYKAIEVVLHTNEGNCKRTEQLKALEKEAKAFLTNSKFKKYQFEIDYSTEDNFKKSIDVIMEAMKFLVDKYGKKVDDEVAKS